MGRRKSGGFVYKRYAAETQNTVNIRFLMLSETKVSDAFRNLLLLGQPTIC